MWMRLVPFSTRWQLVCVVRCENATWCSYQISEFWLRGSLVRPHTLDWSNPFIDCRFIYAPYVVRLIVEVVINWSTIMRSSLSDLVFNRVRKSPTYFYWFCDGCRVLNAADEKCLALLSLQIMGGLCEPTNQQEMIVNRATHQTWNHQLATQEHARHWHFGVLLDTNISLFQPHS